MIAIFMRASAALTRITENYFKPKVIFRQALLWNIFRMAGLDPAIHQSAQESSKMDCRVKPGNDGLRQTTDAARFQFP
jgi:hypothetical protein